MKKGADIQPTIYKSTKSRKCQHICWNEIFMAPSR